MRRLLLALSLLFAAVTYAGEGALMPFQRGSAKAIVEARAGRPFVLAFWSVECVHCRAELEQLAALSKTHPQLDVVLVSTDSPDASLEVLGVLGRYDLRRAERWIFADDFTERLRFEVDPHWHGELPRTYLHGPGTAVEGITGRIDTQHMTRWLEAATDGRN
jgi:thiol-disulfide isomerase/thioredoxin